LVTNRCENCGREPIKPITTDGFELCIECTYKIAVLEAKKHYWEAKEPEPPKLKAEGQKGFEFSDNSYSFRPVPPITPNSAKTKRPKA
jgi:hypothetical protein